VLNSLWPELRQVTTELRQIKIVGTRDMDTLSLVNDVAERVNKAIHGQIKKVRTSLQIYDHSFAELTQQGNPLAFRDFLLKSPEMFLSLGERTGMVSHIASFWRYRFPKDRPLRVEMDELLDILQDFHHGLNGANERPTSAHAAAPPAAATG
jgi:hypothetical protein